MRDGFRITGAAVGAIIVVLLLVVGLWALTVAWAPWKGAGEQRKQIQGSADYRIAAYDRFYDLCGSIQALEDQLETMRADRSLPKDQRATNVLALTNQRFSLIRQYNADASKADTRANFLASDLPFSIDPNQEHTTCAA